MRNLLPPDSLLHAWLDAQSIVETPQSFDLVCGCAIIGALMRRAVWYDQIMFKVWPNIGALLVGPSGIGKDTAINQAERQIIPTGRVPMINGTSIEAITGQLSNQGEGMGLLCAKEISALFGPKDWQSGIMTQLTNIMSGGDVVSAGLRSDPSRMIRRPTVTFLGGSTVDWLHTHMPDGANEGGFMPRLLVVVESKNKRSVPLIDWLRADERGSALDALQRWEAGLRSIIERYGAKGRFEFASAADARHYMDWYDQRFTKFSAFAHAYAHRSRDNALRLAMHCAISCGRLALTQEDVAFAVGIIEYIASKIDVVFAPPTLEGRIAEAILHRLPMHKERLFAELGRAFKPRDIEATYQFLSTTKQIANDPDGRIRKGQTA